MLKQIRLRYYAESLLNKEYGDPSAAVTKIIDSHCGKQCGIIIAVTWLGKVCTGEETILYPSGNLYPC